MDSMHETQCWSVLADRKVRVRVGMMVLKKPWNGVNMAWWNWLLALRWELKKKCKANHKRASIQENCRWVSIIKELPNFYLRHGGERKSLGHLGKTWVDEKDMEAWVRLGDVPNITEAYVEMAMDDLVNLELLTDGGKLNSEL